MAMARPVVPAAGLLFLAASVPLTRRAWDADRPLTPWVPAFLLARSLAQGIGLALGFAYLGVRWAGTRPRPGPSTAAPGVPRTMN
jgi:hypothetical protein